MRKGIDCAFAGTTEHFNLAAEDGVEWVGEYFGGTGAYHAWSDAERAARRASNIKLSVPIWVPNQRFNTDPIVEAKQAIHGAITTGYNEVIGLDVEEGSGATSYWLNAFGETIVSAGYAFVMYHGGDKPVPPMAHSWLASWLNSPPSTVPARSAQQWHGGINLYNMSVDLNLADDAFPLEGASQQKWPPPPPPLIERIVFVNVPQLQMGNNGESVKAIQKLLGNLVVDGSFGPRTQGAVKVFQQTHRLVADGVVGAHTWGSLLGAPQ